MHLKSVIYIDVFLRNQHCIDIFKRNLKQFKKFKIPIFLISNEIIPEEIQQLVDHAVYVDNNMYFTNEYSEYELLTHFDMQPEFKIEKVSSYKQKYGLSVLSNLYKGAHMIKILGYDSFIKMEWDQYIGDKDLELFKNFIDEFKIGNYKGKFLINPNHTHDYLHKHFSAIVWSVNIDYFIINFPKILNENDYAEYIIKKFNNRTFRTVERVLYFSLVDSHTNDVKLENLDVFFSQLIDSNINLHITPVNYEEDCFNTDTTYKIFGKFANIPEKLIIFSFNISYLNPDNPNYEYIEYIITTSKTQFTINHRLNTGCWSYNLFSLDHDDYPIKIKCGDKELTYKSIEDVTINFTKH
jgi:hypothetical protein